MLTQIHCVMAEASGIVSPEWLISDNTGNDNSADAVDKWLLKNLQGKDLDGDLAIDRRNRAVCHSGRQL